jgi:O-antigen ligase
VRGERQLRRVRARRLGDRATSLDVWTRGLLLVIATAWAASVIVGLMPVLEVLTLVGFGTALIGLRLPAVGILGIGMLCTLDAVSRLFVLTGGLLRWNTFNYLLVAAAVLFLPYLRTVSRGQLALLLSFTALLALELTISAEPALGVQHLLGLLALFGLLALLARAGPSPELWQSMALVNGTLAGLGGLVFFVTQTDLINRNAWGWFPLTAILSIALAAGTSGAGHVRFSLVLLAFVNLVWLFLSASRGDLIVGVLAILFVIVSGRGIGRGLVYAAAGAAVVVVLVGRFVPLADEAFARLDKLTQTDTSLRARTSGRSDLALGGWYIFVEHPFGVGTGGFARAWAELGVREGLSDFQRGEEFSAHAGWVKTLAENGVPGFGLLLAFVASFAVIGWGQTNKQLRLLGLLTTAVVATAFLSTEFQSKGVWFLTAGTMTLFATSSPVSRRAWRGRRRARPIPMRPLVVAPQ